MSVDIRSRVDGEVDAVDPAACFGEVLPAAFEQERDLLAHAVEVFAPTPLVIEVAGEPWTLAVDDGVVLRTTAAQLNDLVADQVTVVGMQTNGTLDQLSLIHISEPTRPY